MSSHNSSHISPTAASSQKSQKFDKYSSPEYNHTRTSDHLTPSQIFISMYDQQMSILHKPQLLALTSMALVASSLTRAASTTIYTDANHAIQTIEKIIFTHNGLPGDHEVELTTSGGTIYISGSFLSNNDPRENKLKSGDPTSTIIGGGGQNLENKGSNSAIFAGNDNTIQNGSTNSVILAGKNGKIQGNKNTIGGGEKNTIKNGSHNTIAGGLKTTLEGTHNTAFAAQSSLNGSHNIIAGTYIDNTKNLSHTFTWSDNNTRGAMKKYLTPTSSSTLYLRSENGVSIGDSTPEATLSVGGLVQIGDESSISTCSAEQRGTIFFRNGCYYACSETGKLDNIGDTTSCEISGKTRSPAHTPAVDDADTLTELVNKFGPIAERYHKLREDRTLTLP